ncbi:MAG: hypothetical protein JW820_10875, partial [Spirochaetales bacterium]|nr:hypothetical protein [Spirochaetales bacterium]
MTKVRSLQVLLVAGAALLIVFGGCELVSRDFYRSDDPVPDEGKGMLVLVLDDGAIPNRTLVPSIDMDIETYDILGDYLATPGEPYELNATDVDPDTDEHFIGNVYYRTDMTPGDWAITVIAKN